MSMKQVLAAFMGVTLLVGNGPVSVFAEEAAVEAAAEPAIVNLETQGRTNPIGVDLRPTLLFPGRCSLVRLGQLRNLIRLLCRIKREAWSGIPVWSRAASQMRSNMREAA